MFESGHASRQPSARDGITAYRQSERRTPSRSYHHSYALHSEFMVKENRSPRPDNRAMEPTTFRRIDLVLILLLCVLGCMDQDPLNLSQRKVAGRYMLERFESGKFYLERKGSEQGGGGCIEGTVEAIGWTNGFIFAKRYATFRGDPDGWMVIDTAKESMVGPLPEAEFRQKYLGVQTFSPEDAWKKL